jgi:hypothetical protein
MVAQRRVPIRVGTDMHKAATVSRRITKLTASPPTRASADYDKTHITWRDDRKQLHRNFPVTNTRPFSRACPLTEDYP